MTRERSKKKPLRGDWLVEFSHWVRAVIAAAPAWADWLDKL